jgi:hypothetical protein
MIARMKRGLSLTFLGVASLGCSAQVEPDYEGEPLATIQGTVVTGDAPPIDDMEAALVWSTSTEPGIDVFVVGRTRVTGAFPARFTLDVLEPPPAGTAPEPGSVTIGIIAAIPARTGNVVDPTSLLGVADTAGVLYFPEDGKDPNDHVSRAANYYKVPPVAGYHLWRSVVTEETEAANVRCANDGLCAHMILSGLPGVDDPETLARFQRWHDEEQARCLKYIPDAASCTLWPDTDTPEKDAEFSRCLDLVIQRQNRQQARTDAGIHCPQPDIKLENTEGFGFPVVVTLGRTMNDVVGPRLH